MAIQSNITSCLPWLLAVLTMSAAIEVSTTNSTDQNVTVSCANEGLYDDLDIRDVMGNWKVQELYLHIANEGVTKYNSCPVAKLWEVDEIPTSTYGPSSVQPPYHVEHMKAKFRQSYRHLRLLWDEAGQNIEYALYFRNDSIGYWQVLDGQNGTIASRSHYQQFSGTIQVLKAVSNHLVLNFCQEAANGRPAQLYSVLFSREPSYLDRRDIESVHSLLQNKHLSVASRRMVCGNSGDRPLFNIMLSLLTCVLAFVCGAST